MAKAFKKLRELAGNKFRVGGQRRKAPQCEGVPQVGKLAESKENSASGGQQRREVPQVGREQGKFRERERELAGSNEEKLRRLAESKEKSVNKAKQRSEVVLPKAQRQLNTGSGHHEPFINLAN